MQRIPERHTAARAIMPHSHFTLTPLEQRQLDWAAKALAYAGTGELLPMSHLRYLLESLTKGPRLRQALADRSTRVFAFPDEQFDEYMSAIADELEELPSNQELRALIRQHFLLALEGDDGFWRDFSHMPVAFDVVTSSGQPLILGYDLDSFVHKPHGDWIGLFASREAFRRSLHRDDYWTDIREFDALSDEQVFDHFCTSVIYFPEDDDDESEGDDLSSNVSPSPFRVDGLLEKLLGITELDAEPEEEEEREWEGELPLTDEERAAIDDDGSLPDRVTTSQPWYMQYPYFVAQPLTPRHLLEWCAVHEDESAAFEAYTQRVAANFEQFGETGTVLLFDCRNRKLLAASVTVDAERKVRDWLGKEG